MAGFGYALTALFRERHDSAEAEDRITARRDQLQDRLDEEIERRRTAEERVSELERQVRHLGGQP